MFDQLTETQSLLQNTVQDICRRSPGGIISRADERRPMWRLFAEAGLPGIVIPEGLDGSGNGLLEAALVAYEMGRGARFGSFIDTVAASYCLKDINDKHIKDLLKNVAKGTTEILVFRPFDIADPGKGFVTPGGADGSVVLFVDGRSPGFHLVPLAEVAAGQLPTTGRNGELLVQLPDRLDAAKRVGGPREISVMHAALTNAVNKLICAQLLGAGRAMLGISTEYALERKQFGHAIGSYQAVQHVLAELLSFLEGTEILLGKILLEDDAKDIGAVAATFAFTRDTAWKAVVEAYNVLGGVGWIEDHPVNSYMRGMTLLLAMMDSTDRWQEAAAMKITRGHWL